MISLAVASVLAAGVSRADLITYDATGVISEIDGVSPLSGNVGDSLSVVFTVDTAAPVYSTGQGTTIFNSPIVTASASLNANTLAIGTFANQVVTQGDYFDGANYNSGWQAYSNFDPNANTGNLSAFTLITASAGTAPQNLYQDDPNEGPSLANAPLPAGAANVADLLVLQFESFSQGAVATTGDILIGGNVSIQALAAPEIDSTSLAGGLTLLAGLMAVLRGRRRAPMGQARG
jgi:hypothetical protein